MIRVAKTEALISFAVISKLICVFVFAYAKCWFSHDVAQLSLILFISGLHSQIVILVMGKY